MWLIVCLVACFLNSLNALTHEERQQQLKYGIESVIAEADPTALVGVKVYSFDENCSLYERNAQCRFVPSSTVKIITAGAALYHLGEEAVFETEVATDGVIEEGVVKGNCYLKGSGDPSLTALDLVSLIEQLGDIRAIEGDMILDLSCFEDAPLGPGWMWDEEPAFWSVPMSALNIEHNFIEGLVIFEPEKLAATLVRGLLERKGISFSGVLREGKAPEKGKRLACHHSKSIKELLGPILKNTDNLYSDCLFKRMGGSWKKGKEQVEKFLKEVVGLNPEELVVVDGCGLSRYNLVSPDQMIQILRILRSNRVFNESLPVGGIDGTLRHRMEGIVGKVRAKTGSMTGLSSLCGYVTTEAGEELALAIFENGYIKQGRDMKKQIEDEICTLLVKLKRVGSE